MKKKNQSAVRLGRLARGKPKRYSPEERARRSAQMKAINDKRREQQKAEVIA